MYVFLLLFTIALTGVAETNIWVNSSGDHQEFKAHVLNEGDITIADYVLENYEKRNMDQHLLLEKIDLFSKNKLDLSSLDKGINQLQKTYIFSSSNRLLLFEYLKTQAAAAKNLCHLYSNDKSLKESEPFFDSSCELLRVTLSSLNPNLTKFDYLLIDGNQIDIQSSPYFFTSGQTHQFVFISNTYQTTEINSTAPALKKAKIILTPWVEGQCDEARKIKNHTHLSEPVKIYFSKDCQENTKPQESATLSFIKKNKYYLISGLLISLAALYVSSQYELGVGPP